MPSSEVHWASVPGLRAAAIRIEAEGRRFDRIVSDLYGRVNNTIVNPETFGTDHGGEKFFAKWDKDVRDWDEGVRSVSRSVLATARGVDNMADAVDRTDKDTTRMAESLGRYVGGDSVLGDGGSDGGLNTPGIPPLTPPTSGGSGGGNTGGSNGRR